MVTLIDAVILTGSGLLGGIATGLAIRNKQIKNLKEEVDAGDGSYMRLLDKYMELFSSHRDLKFAAKPKTTKRGPGRPKGSKNKITAKKPGPKRSK
jgi:hypothetical protein